MVVTNDHAIADVRPDGCAGLTGREVKNVRTKLKISVLRGAQILKQNEIVSFGKMNLFKREI